MKEEIRSLRPRVEKIFFSPGDLVQLKQDIPFKPVMIVQSVDKQTIRKTDPDSSMLLGISCIWFDSTLKLNKHRFNTKDLEKINDYD